MANSTAMLVLRRIGINNCRTQEAARWRRRRGGEPRGFECITPSTPGENLGVRRSKSAPIYFS